MAARPARRAGAAVGNARRRRAERPRTRPRRWPSWYARTASARTMTSSNAVGLLHHEMRRLRLADHARRRSGARAGGFGDGGRSRRVLPPRSSGARRASQRSRSCASRSTRCPTAGLTIVATGPLTAAALAASIGAATGADSLAFFDAIAPIVHRDSIDMDVCWMAARWDKGGKDYINCPMDKEQYLAFHAGPARRREERVQGVGGEHALFRRLHADRGDGRARRRHAALTGR